MLWFGLTLQPGHAFFAYTSDLFFFVFFIFFIFTYLPKREVNILIQYSMYL